VYIIAASSDCLIFYVIVVERRSCLHLFYIYKICCPYWQLCAAWD